MRENQLWHLKKISMKILICIDTETDNEESLDETSEDDDLLKMLEGME